MNSASLNVRLFENYVNYAGSKTPQWVGTDNLSFENYVNYAGSKTLTYHYLENLAFENYVNYAGSKTLLGYEESEEGLRTM